MLTIEQLKNMPALTVFATGVAKDEPNGLFMANTGKELRWIAMRGDIHDWTIYCHFSDKDIEWIKRHGDKPHSEDNIKRCVPCDEDAFKMYRH